MSLVQRAKDLATRAHAGQHRKYNGENYIVHPMRVAMQVAMQSDATEVEIAAAWLHDVLEDCAVEFREELMTFPEEVVTLVQALTNPSKGSTKSRAVRKQMDREHLRSAPLWARKIKLIDRCCNLTDLLIDNAPDDFLGVYGWESILLLAALKGTDNGLEAQLQEVIDELLARLVTGNREWNQ